MLSIAIGPGIMGSGNPLIMNAIRFARWNVVMARTSLAGAIIFLTLFLLSHAQALNLTLNISSTGTEGSTLVAGGTVTLSDTVTNPVTVNLFSDNTNRVRVPASVIVPAGTNVARFDLTLPENDLIDGTEDVFIEAFLDDESGDIDSIRVFDNESRALAIALPTAVTETQGTLTNAGTISFFGKPVANVVIALQSNHPELIAVPALVTNFAGQTNVQFNLSITNNSVTNSADVVQIRASAGGFLSATGTVIFFDDERPFAPTNPMPADLATQVSNMTALSWTFSPNAPTETVYDLYFGTSPTPGAAEFLGNPSTNRWTLPLLAPNTTYFWKIVARSLITMSSPVWHFTTRGVDHFDVSAVDSPQVAGGPFNLTVTARDELNRAVTNFADIVTLSASVPKAISPTNAIGFVNGSWNGSVVPLEEATNMALVARDPIGHFGQSNPFRVLASNQPIVFLSQPVSQTVLTGATVQLSVSVLAASPIYFQWRFNGSGLLGETNTTFVLPNIQASQSGNYNVVVSNRFGSLASSNATIVALPGFFDDFEPGIHSVQWSAFSPTVLATNYGGSVSGANSLWFGGFGQYISFERYAAFARYATSRSIDTRLGGTLDFFLRLGDGTSSRWRRPFLPDEGVVLEYSTTSGSSWVEFGRYDTTNYFAWTHVTAEIPSGAQTANTRFRWAAEVGDPDTPDLSHWALDDVGVNLAPHPPAILLQPTNLLALFGGTATFSVVAQGSFPLTYQWRKDGTNIIGATNATVTISNVLNNQIGEYAAVITNAFGALTSSVATLNLLRDFFDNFEPGIHLLQWSSLSPTVAATNFGGSISGSNALWFGGGTTRFAQTRAIDTTGGGVVDFYLRFADGNVDPNWESLTLPGGIVLEYSTDGGGSWNLLNSYRTATYYSWTHVVEVLPVAAQTLATMFRWSQPSRHDQNGDNWALDDVAVFIRPERPVIIEALGDDIARLTSNAIFRVTVVGSSPLTYRWQHEGTNLIEGGRFSGATDPSLSIANVQESDAGTYSVIISNAAGSVTNTYPALTVIAVNHFSWAPVSSPQPANSPLAVTIEARNYLDQLVTNFSDTVSLYVPSQLYIPITPTTSGAFTNGVWSGFISVNIPSPSPDITLRAEYNLPFQPFGINGSSAPFDVITPSQPPIILTQPTNQLIRPGSNVIFSVRAYGPLPFTYQWRRSGANLADDARISGATSSSLAIANVTASDVGSYSVVISNVNGSAISTNATLALDLLDHFTWTLVAGPPSKTTNSFNSVTVQARGSSNQTITAFTGTVALSGIITGAVRTTNMLGNIVHSSSYVEDGSYTDGYAFTPTNDIRLTHVRHYFGNKVSIWTDSGALLAAQTVTSIPATWVETPLAAPVQLSAGQRYRIGVYYPAFTTSYSRSDLPAAFNDGTIDQSYTSEGDAMPSIGFSTQWTFVDFRYEVKTLVSISTTPSISGNFFNGTWNGNLRINGLGTNVVLRADDGNGRIGLSSPFHVAPENLAPIFLVQPANQVARPGTNVTLFADAYGTAVYSWRRAGTNAPLSGARYGGLGTTALTISNVVESDTDSYFVVAIANGPQPQFSTSSVALVFISAVDHFNWSSITSPQGTNLAFNVSVTARDLANQLVTNYNRTVSFTAWAMSNGASFPLVPVSGTFTSGVWTGSVRVPQVASNVVLRADDGFGHTGVSAPIDVLTQAPVLFTLQPTNQLVLPGTNVTLVAQAFSASPVTYQWRFESTNIPNATNASYSFTNANLTNGHGNFTCVAMDDVSSAVSSNALIFVQIKPGIVTQPQPQAVLQGGNATFSVVATGAPPLWYRWLRNSSPVLTSTVPNITFFNVQASGTVRVIVTNNALPSGVSSAIVSLTMIPDFDGDGVADSWEVLYGMNTNNAADALADFDGDGMNNRDEYLAGTNPTNAASALKIFLTTTNATLLNFVAQSNVAYAVQFRPSLASNSWINFTSFGAQSLTRTAQFSVPNPPPEPARFYRVIIPPTP